MSALLIALLSVVSAAHTVPERDVAAIETYLAFGGDIADICGETDAGHRHDCPFCRLLSDPVLNGPAARADAAEFRVSWPRFADLTQPDAPYGPGLARAPPLFS
ncbi:hypothetical protein [Halovulum sp. GXIMD14793]